MVELGTVLEQGITPEDLVLLLEADGRSRGEVKELLANAIATLEENSLNGAGVRLQTDSDGEDLPIVDEVPDGLIELPAAAAKYERSRTTLHSWIRQGRLQPHARLKGPARGGGYLLIPEADVLALIANPPKIGRPRKKGRLLQ